jgi:hypothetical protein
MTNRAFRGKNAAINVNVRREKKEKNGFGQPVIEV